LIFIIRVFFCLTMSCFIRKINCYYVYISSLILTCYLIIFFNNNNNNNNNLIKNNNAIKDNNDIKDNNKNLDDEHELGIEWGQFYDIEYKDN
jgi:hypothetical protein